MSVDFKNWEASDFTSLKLAFDSGRDSAFLPTIFSKVISLNCYCAQFFSSRFFIDEIGSEKVENRFGFTSRKRNPNEWLRSVKKEKHFSKNVSCLYFRVFSKISNEIEHWLLVSLLLPKTLRIHNITAYSKPTHDRLSIGVRLFARKHFSCTHLADSASCLPASERENGNQGVRICIVVLWLCGRVFGLIGLIESPSTVASIRNEFQGRQFNGRHVGSFHLKCRSWRKIFKGSVKGLKRQIRKSISIKFQLNSITESFSGCFSDQT